MKPQSPKSEAQIRMKAFIAEARKDLEQRYRIVWTDDCWQYPPDREGGADTLRLNFSPFTGPFRDLLKAISAREAVDKDGRADLATKSLIRTAYHLAKAVANLTELSDLNTERLQRATASVNAHRMRKGKPYSEMTKFNIGSNLAAIADLLNTHHLTHHFLDYSNPFKRPESDHHLTAAARGRVQAKLPEEGAMKALGEIYQAVMKQNDERGTEQVRLLICASALLVCTGFRINELLALPADCWHTARIRDAEGRVQEGSFVGYAPEKHGIDNAYCRYVSSAMEGLAKEAVEEIQRITAPYRGNARVRFEGGVNLPGLKEDRIYNATEASALLGCSKNNVAYWLKKDPAARIKKVQKAHRLTAQDLRDLVGARCQDKPVMTYPWRMEVHEALFVVPVGYFKYDGMTGTSTLVLDQTVQAFLGGNPSNKSCFEAFEQRNLDTGKFWKITTHQPRHLLSTLMKRGGFSESDIAAYFGRKNVQSNRAYYGLTAPEIAEMARKAMQGDNFEGPLQEIIDNLQDPVRREEVIEALSGIAQLSPLGICLHRDGVDLPPPPERCAVCPGLAIIKGHPDLVEETKQQLEAAERVLESAKCHHAEGHFGWGPWMRAFEERRDRLRMMLDVHENPSIPHLKLIHLGNPLRKDLRCESGSN